jgi:glucose/arabinose dehydrogenase
VAPAWVALISGILACGGENLEAPPTGHVSQVIVTGAADTIRVGESLQLSAVARDSAGNELSVPAFIWTSDDGAVVAVSQSGTVTGVAPGRADVSASVDGVVGSLVMTVVATSPVPGTGTPSLQTVATGLASPLYLVSPPGDQRLFVVEKGGRIRIIKEGMLLPDPFLDLSEKVSDKEEQGLLGLAFPPDYASSGRFVVHYTDLQGDTRISTFRVSGSPDRADPASESPVLSVDQPGPAHNGGQILFSSDGKLYIGLGDGGSHDGNDAGRGQSLSDLLGAILRIDVSTGLGYSVPVDNPFVATAGARGEIWSYGLRNPWRFSFDPATGDLFIADVGERRWEELNVSRAVDGAGRGVNYGWSRMEGTTCLHGNCDGLALPLVEYDHANGCAVIGGYVYRGAALPTLQGQYFYGDFCKGWVRSLPADGSGQPVDWPALAVGRHLTSFGEDAAGELYILSEAGTVFKVVPR